MKKIKKIFVPILLIVLTLALGLTVSACAKKVKLTFETNGGAPVAERSAEVGSSFEMPVTAKNGFAFEGWYSSSDFSSAASGAEITVPEEDTVYYAKWAPAYTVKFDADGGVFAEGEPTLSLAAGADLYDAVKEIVPTKSGLIFGSWAIGDALLTRGDKMPEGDVTLTAKYTVGYTVEMYLHNLAGNSYVLHTEKVLGTDYVGTRLTLEAPALGGFTHTDTPENGEPVDTLLLSATASENVFRFYYERMHYSVMYFANLPEDEAEGEIPSQTVIYGGKAEAAENGFTADGYRFLGWGTSATANVVEYHAGDQVPVTGDTVLYAVWERGYRDRFGSNDVIFFPEESPEKAILRRGGRDFEGMREGSTFTFTLGGNKKLTGAVFGAMFSYAREELEGTYVLYDGYADPEYDGIFDEKRFKTGVTLTIDEYLNATYKDGNDVFEGTVEYDEMNGDYLFTGGGKQFNCLFSETDVKEHPYVFSVGGSEADVYIDWWFIGDTGMGFSNGNVLILDGYGAAILQYSASGFPLQFTGSYYIMGEYVANGYPMKKIYCEVNDDMGILGETEGIYGNYIYTFPLSEMIETEDIGAQERFSGYVIAEETHRGEFKASDGSTLTLDGFGLFPDSAVYKNASGDTVYESAYTVESDYTTGRVIVVKTDEGFDYFKLSVTGKNFEKLSTETAKKYKEYRLVNSMLDFPLVVIYDEETKDGFKTELYMTENDGDTVVLAADGYCKTEALGGGFTLYTFTRSKLYNNYLDAELPRTMKFYTTVVISSEALDEVEVYCILQYNDREYARTIEIEGEGTLWANDEVTLTGVGSLLFREDDTVVEGSFSETQNRYFRGTYGTFIYGDGMSTYTLRFDISAGTEENKWVGTPIEDVETELYFYYYDPETRQGVYLVDLVLGADGVASWNDDRGYGTWQRGVYAVTDYTVLGDEIYTLTIGGAEKFEFIIYNYLNPDGSTTPIYFLRDEEYEGTYTAADGSVLILDGFYRASYTVNGEAALGTYDVDEDGLAVYFTPDEGEGRFFEFEGKDSFVALDAAYGEWYLVNSSYEIINNSTVFFDGKGELTVLSTGGKESKGIYTVVQMGDLLECKVTANFGGKYTMGEYLVSLEYFANSNMYACVIYDKNTTGVFVDEDWNVLRLDGYGNGALYTADRGLAGSGYYYVVDEGKNFLDFTFDTSSSVYGTDAYIVLDVEHNTFKLQDYSQFGLVYFSDKMDYIVFGTDGTVYVGNSSGYYLAEESGITAYLYNYATESLVKTPMPALSHAQSAYTYNNVTYTLWDGKEISLNGKVQLLDKDGKVMEGREPLNASMKFTPVLGSNYDLDASFTLNNEEYDDFTLNFYTDGKLDPRVTYNSVDYPISFVNGASFTVSAGYTSMTYQDYYANYLDESGSHRGGKIVKEWIGFGPVVLEEATYSGAFHYLYDEKTFPEPITFNGVKQEKVVINGYRAQLEDELEIVFDFKGTTYAIDFFEYDIYYSLYSFYRYDTVEANDGYTVGVKYLLYTNVANTPGYGRLNEDREKPMGATLFKEDGTAVVTYDTNIVVGSQAVWMAEYDKEKKTAGTGYYIAFTVENGKVTEAEVSTHKFWQVLTNARDYMADVFLDGEGNITHVLSVAYLDYAGAFTWMDGTSGLVHEEEEDVWTFEGCMGGEPVPVTVQFLRGADNPTTHNPVYTMKVIVGN